MSSRLRPAYALAAALAASMAASGSEQTRTTANLTSDDGELMTAGEQQQANLASLVIRRAPDTGSVADVVGAKTLRSWQDHEVIAIPRDELDAVRALLQLHPDVRSIEVDSVVTPPDPEAAEAPSQTQAQGAQTQSDSVNDPEYRYQNYWHSHDAYKGASDIISAFEVSARNQKLDIVVIDGGFAEHPDLDWAGGADFVGDDRGHLSYDADSCEDYHGQSVASVIGSKTNNGDGMAGIVDVNLYAARALACDNTGHMSDVARAIRWAAGEDVGTDSTLDEPADLVNLSLGASTRCSHSLQSAVDAANEAGVTVVASAGNNGEDAHDYAPAGCDGVLTVGAVTLAGSQASFSNHGDPVDLSALGQQVRVQGPDGYRWMNGTSFSAPIVTGILGLLKQDIPELERSDLRDLALESTTEFSATTDDIGEGVLNAPLLQSNATSLFGLEGPALHHAVGIRAESDSSAYWDHMDDERLCSLYEFAANNQDRNADEEFVVFRVPEGAPMNVSNADPEGSSADSRFVLSGMNPEGFDYGLQLCRDGSASKCRDEKLMELHTERMEKPGRCQL